MGGPWAQARNFAVITGVHAGIAAAVRRVRKKDDTYTAYALFLGVLEQSKPVEPSICDYYHTLYPGHHQLELNSISNRTRDRKCIE